VGINKAPFETCPREREAEARKAGHSFDRVLGQKSQAPKNVLHPPIELCVGNTLLRETDLPCIACCRSSVRFGSVHEPDTNDGAEEPANRGDEAECFAGLDTPCS
jgi:hypothetical protein